MHQIRPIKNAFLRIYPQPLVLPASLFLGTIFVFVLGEMEASGIYWLLLLLQLDWFLDPCRFRPPPPPKGYE